MQSLFRLLLAGACRRWNKAVSITKILQFCGGSGEQARSLNDSLELTGATPLAHASAGAAGAPIHALERRY